MKKGICLLLSLTLALMMSLALTGCGDETAPVKEAADGCLAAMADGDMEKAKEFCDEDVFKTGSLSSFSEFESITDSLAESAGIKADDLSDEAKDSIEKFKDDFLDQLIDSYEIGDVTMNDDGTATVNAKVTYGYDIDKMQKIDFNKMDDAEKIIQKYMTDHQSELLSIYQSEGQTKAMAKMINDVLPDLMDMLADKINTEAAGTTDEDTVLTLEQKDDKWLVTKMEAKQ